MQQPIYLDVITAQNQLTTFGSFTLETVPDAECMTEILLDIEALIDGWVGRRIAETQYCQKLECNSKGVARLPIAPVTMVQRVLQQDPHNPQADPYPVPGFDVSALWDGFQFVGVGCLAFITIQVTYTAGYPPSEIPREFKQAAIALLRYADKNKAIQSGMLDPLAFDDPYREATMIALPGGLTKTFTGKQSKNPEGKTKTQLDHILSRYLESFRHFYSYA